MIILADQFVVQRDQPEMRLPRAVVQMTAPISFWFVRLSVAIAGDRPLVQLDGAALDLISTVELMRVLSAGLSALGADDRPVVRPVASCLDEHWLSWTAMRAKPSADGA